MMTAYPNAADQKKDLHFGGLGRTSSAPLAAVADPPRRTADDWRNRARGAVEAADEFLHASPWTALALAAALGLAAGFLLTRSDTASAGK